MAEESETLSLAVPADPAFIGTVRLFATAVGRHIDGQEDLIEDLQLALTEAVAEPIEAGVGGVIEVRTTLDEDVRIEIRSASWGDPTGNGQTFLRHSDLVRALFADTEVVVVGGDRLLRFGLGSRALPR